MRDKDSFDRQRVTSITSRDMIHKPFNIAIFKTSIEMLLRFNY